MRVVLALGGVQLLSPAPTLTLSNISKAYGATIALESVDMALAPGEVHALLGENGAGKSTLVKVLTGVVQPDSGALTLGGVPYSPHSILEARRAGLAAAFQELSLLPNLTVAQNLLLPELPRGPFGMVSTRATNQRAGELLDAYCLHGIRADDVTGELTLAQRQRLEIVRAIENGSKVLVLDEPTAALAEVDWLFDLVRKVTSQGTAVLYISHRLGEVRTLCRRATVLRNGKSIGTVDLAGVNDDEIFEMMVGYSADVDVDKAQHTAVGDAVLKVSRLTGERVRDVSFSLAKGEVLGVAALEGQGQRQLFRTLVGLEKTSGGAIHVNGKKVEITSPRQAMRTGGGIAFLPEERKTEGILESLTAAANITLPVVGRISFMGFLSGGAERRAGSKPASTLDLEDRYLDFPIGDLSGGNQQKALLARLLLTGASILVLYDPTRGVDVGTKQSIYRAIRSFAADGGAVLVYSSELQELVHLVDRCLVLYRDAVFSEFSGKEITEQRLVAAMTGHGPADSEVSGTAKAGAHGEHVSANG